MLWPSLRGIIHGIYSHGLRMATVKPGYWEKETSSLAAPRSIREWNPATETESEIGGKSLGKQTTNVACIVKPGNICRLEVEAGELANQKNHGCLSSKKNENMIAKCRWWMMTDDDGYQWCFIYRYIIQFRRVRVQEQLLAPCVLWHPQRLQGYTT